MGCGTGSLLQDFKVAGFENIRGVDKYIEKDQNNPVKIMKGDIQSVEGKWDLIIFNHSLEHMEDQHGTLKSASNLLTEKGTCIINLPIVSSYAWKTYGTNWFHLDAPRHFFLHSVKSLEILTGKTNLALSSIVYNSTGSSLLRSEQYKMGIPMTSKNIESIFSKKQIKLMSKKAEDLNLKGEGDTAMFSFERKV